MRLHKKRSYRKSSVLLASLVILVALVAAGSYAFLTAKTPALVNTFSPVTVTPGVEEDIDGSIKKEVKIKNNGDMPVYIRAKIVVNWVDTNEAVIAAVRPVEGTDYTYDIPANTGWELGADGYYYYTDPVPVGGTTDILLKDGKELQKDDKYDISMTILSQTIQSDPVETVISKWNSGVSGVTDAGKLIITASQGGGTR